MKLFTCESCAQTLYFDNFRCIRCDYELGFLPDKMVLVALEPSTDNTWHASGAGKKSTRYRKCANYAEHNVCNWMIPQSDPDEFCIACQLNQTIPDLDVEGHKTLWGRLEAGKRRLVFSLLRLGLPLEPKQEPDSEGLAFAFMADHPEEAFREDNRVFTGHNAGLITLNIAEADHAVREEMRQQMAEPYRTLLGHFRHESGHYYWDRLILDSDWLEPFRALFGDETQDYQESLKSYYKKGAPADWQNSFVSTYASSHPWEDWAETWAHYLHIVDTLETARAFGLRVKPRVEESEDISAQVSFDPYRSNHFEPLLEQWLPVTYALNSLNQSMGHPELYPFVLAPAAIEKLAFVHQVILRQPRARKLKRQNAKDK